LNECPGHKRAGLLLEYGKTMLIALIKNLWDRYVVSSGELEPERREILKMVDGYFRVFGYLK
jgi:hypothetical protein